MKLLSRGNESLPLDLGVCYLVAHLFCIQGGQFGPPGLGGSIVSMLPRLLKLLLTPSERRGNPLTARG